jgi:ornithine cyclodeaminase
MLDAATVFVEFEPQSRVEGEILQVSDDFPVTEFWRVLAGHEPGCITADEVTIFESVGFALEDCCALSFVRDAAAELGIGDIIELVSQAAEPKDRFGLLRPRGRRGDALRARSARSRRCMIGG